MDDIDFEECLEQFADTVANLEIELEQALEQKYVFHEVGKNFVNYMKWLREYSPDLQREIKETMDEFLESQPKINIVKKEKPIL